MDKSCYGVKSDNSFSSIMAKRIRESLACE